MRSADEGWSARYNRKASRDIPDWRRLSDLCAGSEFSPEDSRAAMCAPCPGWFPVMSGVCTDQRRAELPCPARRPGGPDGNGLCGPGRRVQRRGGDGGLAPPRRQAAGAELRGDQVLAPGCGRLGLVPPAASRRPRPSHPAPLGHERIACPGWQQPSLASSASRSAGLATRLRTVASACTEA